MSWTRVAVMQLSSTQCRASTTARAARSLASASARSSRLAHLSVLANRQAFFANSLLITPIAASAHAQRPLQSRAFVSG
jgi:hypothetical protein